MISGAYANDAAADNGDFNFAPPGRHRRSLFA